MHHSDLSAGTRQAFFDHIADGWDARVAKPDFLERLRRAFDELGVQPGETVLDLGCGTGNLTQLLLARVSEAGRVIAVDFSPRMIALAEEKIGADARLTLVLADAGDLPLPDASVDRVVCFSAWPHFPDGAAVAAQLARILRPGGMLHVLHVASRQTINHIHARAAGPVAHDLLIPAAALAALFADFGLPPRTVIDAGDLYHVAAQRRADVGTT
jgi:ubiquinone/menaquinone biosynthesis C-methylase UbiE